MSDNANLPAPAQTSVLPAAGSAPVLQAGGSTGLELSDDEKAA